MIKKIINKLKNIEWTNKSNQSGDKNVNVHSYITGQRNII